MNSNSNSDSASASLTNCTSSCYTSDVDECAICLETLTNTKCCTTDCGHTFHSRCIFKNFKNSFDCPLCRRELVEEDEDLEEDQETATYDSGSYESTTINTSTEEEDENNPAKLRIQQVYDAIKKKGYTELDFISFLMIDNFPNEIKKKKDVFWRCIAMMQEIDNICEREIAVDYRDTRTYATVLQQGITLHDDE
jgi:uncharacterized protein (UPF0297 family)